MRTRAEVVLRRRRQWWQAWLLDQAENDESHTMHRNSQTSGRLVHVLCWLVRGLVEPVLLLGLTIHIFRDVI